MGWPGTCPDLTGLPGAGIESGWRKNKERKNPVWPGKTRSKIWLQPVDFFFFLLKRCRFDFLKKLTRATRSKSGIQTLDRTGSENYAVTVEPKKLKEPNLKLA